MNTVIFKIKGNQEDWTGNPIPYVRSTQRGQFLKNVKRYNEWKEYVRMRFVDELKKAVPEKVRLQTQRRVAAGLKPIVLAKKQRAYMQIVITYKDCNHGDGDNVWKGIADALFEDDKHVDGRFIHIHGTEGEVDVILRIYKPIVPINEIRNHNKRKSAPGRSRRTKNNGRGDGVSAKGR